MIIGGVFFCLSFLSSLAFHFPKSRSLGRFRIRPGNPSPILLNQEVEFANQPFNSMMRRGPDTMQANLQLKTVKKKYHDDLKSLELDDSLERLLALDAQQRKLKKQKLGLKVVNVDDFVIDRSKNTGNEKLKLIQSLAPPEHFFKKYKSAKSRKQEKKPELNKYSNIGYKVVNVNDFDHDRMIKKKVRLIQSLDPPKTFFKRYTPDGVQDEDSKIDISQVQVKKNENKYRKSKKKHKKSVLDDNGLLYIKKPKVTEGENNKDLEFDDSQENSVLLHQPTKQLTKDDRNQIQLIARAIDEEYRDEDQRDELDQLFQNEKLQMQDESDSIDELMINRNRIEALRSKKRLAPDYYQKNNVAQLIRKVMQQSLAGDFGIPNGNKRFDGSVKDLTKLLLLNLSAKPKGRKQEAKQLKQIARAVQGTQGFAGQNSPVDDLQFDFDQLVA